MGILIHGFMGMICYINGLETRPGPILNILECDVVVKSLQFIT